MTDKKKATPKKKAAPKKKPAATKKAAPKGKRPDWLKAVTPRRLDMKAADSFKRRLDRSEYQEFRGWLIKCIGSVDPTLGKTLVGMKILKDETKIEKEKSTFKSKAGKDMVREVTRQVNIIDVQVIVTDPPEEPSPLHPVIGWDAFMTLGKEIR